MHRFIINVNNTIDLKQFGMFLYPMMADSSSAEVTATVIDVPSLAELKSANDEIETYLNIHSFKADKIQLCICAELYEDLSENSDLFFQLAAAYFRERILAKSPKYTVETFFFIIGSQKICSSTHAQSWERRKWEPGLPTRYPDFSSPPADYTYEANRDFCASALEKIDKNGLTFTIYNKVFSSQITMYEDLIKGRNHRTSEEVTPDAVSFDFGDSDEIELRYDGDKKPKTEIPKIELDFRHAFDKVWEKEMTETHGSEMVKYQAMIVRKPIIADVGKHKMETMLLLLAYLSQTTLDFEAFESKYNSGNGLNRVRDLLQNYKDRLEYVKLKPESINDKKGLPVEYYVPNPSSGVFGGEDYFEEVRKEVAQMETIIKEKKSGSNTNKKIREVCDLAKKTVKESQDLLAEATKQCVEDFNKKRAAKRERVTSTDLLAEQEGLKKQHEALSTEIYKEEFLGYDIYKRLQMINEIEAAQREITFLSGVIDCIQLVSFIVSLLVAFAAVILPYILLQRSVFSSEFGIACFWVYIAAVFCLFFPAYFFVKRRIMKSLMKRISRLKKKFDEFIISYKKALEDLRKKLGKMLELNAVNAKLEAIRDYQELHALNARLAKWHQECILAKIEKLKTFADLIEGGDQFTSKSPEVTIDIEKNDINNSFYWVDLSVVTEDNNNEGEDE